MILAVNTASPVCYVHMYAARSWRSVQWEAGRGLAKGLLKYLEEAVSAHADFPASIDGIIVYQGPGSFTGLRIGLTVLNTIADSQHVPIVGTVGEEWLQSGLDRLSNHENDQLVMPEYGAEPHITTPRK
jgi:tRNA threonylcarbamoyladenosine biosynthesis protein TsaB